MIFRKHILPGGEPVFQISHETEWGDEYIYIYFDRDPADQAWHPSSDKTAWEYAEGYMKTTELFAKYFRETAIGPLPQHTVLFTNVISFLPFIQVKTNTDWFHYMQIWPKYSEPEIVHHLFHQYSFFVSQSKLPLDEFSTIGSLLTEGLPTYFEQVVPSELLKDNRYQGKLFEFYVLDRRGERFNIRENAYHNRYNVSALKVYLLEQYIRDKTGGSKSVSDFTKELWNKVKDAGEPQEVSEGTIIDAFATIVGEANQGYLTKLAEEHQLSEEYFIPLLPHFDSYMNWMSNEYFWGNRLLFLSFLDIVSAKGGDWPHGATYPHNILRYRRDALIPFREYLKSLGKTTFSKTDIVDAMGRVTGKDHASFFEFWKSLGINLDPNSLAPLDKWNPKEIDEYQFLPQGWSSVGTLKSEHYLSGIPQQATAILDKPDDDGQILIEVRLHDFENYPPESEVREALGGQHVSMLSSHKYEYENVFSTSAFFKVTTDDADRRKFTFSLTLPPPSFHPIFRVSNYPLGSGSYTGELYWLHSIDSIDIDVELVERSIMLPDTSLDGETYVLKLPEGEIRYEPQETINIPDNVQSVEISLFDKFRFLRAKQIIDLSSSEPTSTTTETPPDTTVPPPATTQPPSELSKPILVPWIVLGLALLAIPFIVIVIMKRRT